MALLGIYIYVHENYRIYSVPWDSWQASASNSVCDVVFTLTVHLYCQSYFGLLLGCDLGETCINLHPYVPCCPAHVSNAHWQCEGFRHHKLNVHLFTCDV